MRYLIYLRVSTKKQDLRSQEDSCLRALRERVGADFDHKIFADSITSRKGVFKREGARAMIAAMQRGDTIVSVSVDRLSRKQVDTMKLADLLEQRGVGFIMINQPGIKNKIMLGIYSGMAEEELITLKRRIAEKFTAKRERKERIGHLPYGYKLNMDPTTFVPIKIGDEVIMKPCQLIPNEDEQKQIALMEKLFDEGQSFRHISQILNREGYRNTAGKPWTHMSIYRVMCRIGKYRPPGSPHAGVDSESLHALAQ